MDQIVFYLLVFAVLGLTGVVVMLVIAYLKLSEKLIKAARQNEYFRQQDDAKIDAILEEAHDRAIIIIDEANKKAAALLTQSTNINQDAASSMEKTIDEASRLHIEEMKKASEALLTAYREALE